ncbi:lipid-binding protein [Elysia marginata]|uniref:Lipid-binding protein n=1 Tax=Elysia marginata TaxID=1093978 RepID=A0AAV4F1Q7_9GAST|nr:lipid-binding protein [Elysia marginata]
MMIFFNFFVVGVVSFSNLSARQVHGVSSIPVEKAIDLENSQIKWKGYKVLGEHAGFVKFSEGTLLLQEQGHIVGGRFKVDLSSLECTDLEGNVKKKLENHLKGKDFFDANSFPYAELTIEYTKKLSKNSYNVMAKLSIRGQTNTEEFKLTTFEGGAIAKLTIDRTKYGANYNSGSILDNLADKTIYDEFDLQVKLIY